MRKRNNRVVVYFNNAELMELNQKVQQSALSRESFIRIAVRNQTVQAAPPADLPKLIYEIRRVGISLNQLLALANSKGFVDVPQLRRVLDANRAMEKMVVDTYAPKVK